MGSSGRLDETVGVGDGVVDTVIAGWLTYRGRTPILFDTHASRLAPPFAKGATMTASLADLAARCSVSYMHLSTWAAAHLRVRPLPPNARETNVGRF